MNPQKEKIDGVENVEDADLLGLHFLNGPSRPAPWAADDFAGFDAWYPYPVHPLAVPRVRTLALRSSSRRPRQAGAVKRLLARLRGGRRPTQTAVSNSLPPADEKSLQDVRAAQASSKPQMALDSKLAANLNELKMLRQRIHSLERANRQHDALTEALAQEKAASAHLARERNAAAAYAESLKEQRRALGRKLKAAQELLESVQSLREDSAAELREVRSRLKESAAVLEKTEACLEESRQQAAALEAEAVALRERPTQKQLEAAEEAVRRIPELEEELAEERERVTRLERKRATAPQWQSGHEPGGEDNAANALALVDVHNPGVTPDGRQDDDDVLGAFLRFVASEPASGRGSQDDA